MLSKALEKNGIRTIQATNDADVDIAVAAIDAALEKRTVVIGDDTHLLIFLIYLTDSTRLPVQFRSDQCRQTSPIKIWDIKKNTECSRRRYL
jgi:type III secretory pathway component EscU